MKKKYRYKKKSSNQLRKETRRRLKEIGRRNRKFIKLTCSKCRREYKIRINIDHEDLYTKEVKKNYICLLCRRR